MKNIKLIALLVVAAFIAVSSMSYTDEVIAIEYCEQMKTDGTWPAEYQCD